MKKKSAKKAGGEEAGAAGRAHLAGHDHVDLLGVQEDGTLFGQLHDGGAIAQEQVQVDEATLEAHGGSGGDHTSALLN